jgi:hypothetical protein
LFRGPSSIFPHLLLAVDVLRGDGQGTNMSDLYQYPEKLSFSWIKFWGAGQGCQLGYFTVVLVPIINLDSPNTKEQNSGRFELESISTRGKEMRSSRIP